MNEQNCLIALKCKKGSLNWREMMKKITAIILCSILSFTAIACNYNGESSKSSSIGTDAENESLVSDQNDSEAETSESSTLISSEANTSTSSTPTRPASSAIASSAIASSTTSMISSSSQQSTKINVIEEQGPEFDFLKSDRFIVMISPDGGKTWKNSFVYKTKYNLSTDDPIYESVRATDTASYTDFASDFSKKIKVRVISEKEDINSITIRPLDNKIVSKRINSNTYEFELEKARKVSVEVNANLSGYIKHKLFVFSNEIEKNVPDENGIDVYKFTPGGSLNNRIDLGAAWTAEKKTAYFKKGLYYIGEDSLIPSGKNIYLAPGAYVFGSFKSVDPKWIKTYNNIKIYGRGVLDSFNGIRSQVYLQGSNNIVEGIMLLHKYKGNNLTADSSVSSSWLIGTTPSSHNENQNVKVINWMHAGGLFGFYGKFIVNDCFIFTNDDCIDISFPNDAIVTNNVTWNYYNGSAIELSWNSMQPNHKALVDNLDVIHWDSKYDDPGCGKAHQSCKDTGYQFCANTGAKMAVIFASHDNTVTLKNFNIQNVRVEQMSPDSRKRFLSLCVYDNSYSGNPPYHSWKMGGLENIFFKNITIDVPTSNNVIHGHSSESLVSNVTFENLVISGKKATNLSDANITTNDFTSGVRFIE